MNILLICDEYPPGQHGGIGTIVRLMAREMVKLGNNVTVAGLYSLGYGGDDKFEDEGVKVYRFRRWMDCKWFENQKSVMVRASIRLLKDTRIIQHDIKISLSNYKKQLEKIIINEAIDMMEMPDYNDYMRFCKSYIPFPQLPVPTIVKMHGSITFTTKISKMVPLNIVKMEQAVLEQAVAVSAVSSYVADKTAVYLSYLKKIEVLHNGINTDIPMPDPQRNLKQVIYTGALIASKGIYQLVKAWNIVNREIPEAQLLILGKGDQLKVADFLNMQARDTVQFMGHVPTERLYHYLSASLIGIFPSYSEAFALAPLEAMACGTTVITSGRTSGPELIDDSVDGLLIDPDDVGQIAASIIYLLNNPKTCSALSKNASKKLKEHFDINVIARQTILFYKRVLQDISQKVKIN